MSRKLTLDEIQKCDTTEVVGHEVVQWDSKDPMWLEAYSWPCYTQQYLRMRSPLTMSRMLRLLMPLGYKIVGIYEYRHGFLWLKKGFSVTMQREFDWSRQGSETSFVGTRKTTSLEQQLYEGRELSDAVMAAMDEDKAMHEAMMGVT